MFRAFISPIPGIRVSCEALSLKIPFTLPTWLTRFLASTLPIPGVIDKANLYSSSLSSITRTKLLFADQSAQCLLQFSPFGFIQGSQADRRIFSGSTFGLYNNN